jgi:hypothetical protein
LPKKNDPEQMQLALRSTAAPKKMRLGNVSIADTRKFYEALASEQATAWTDSNGVVRKLNRRGTAAQTFSASSEILSQPTAAAKARVTRQRTAAKNAAIRANQNKSAFGETKRQKATAGQERLLNIDESDDDIMSRIQRDIKKNRGKIGVVGIGMGNLGAGFDEIYAGQMAEGGRGSGGGRMMNRPRKALR